MQKIAFKIIDIKTSLPFSELAITTAPVKDVYIDIELEDNLATEYSNETFSVTKEGLIEIFRQLHSTLTLERSEF